ncbi:matrixin family metalloprotease [Streptococcus caprae]|uniref:Matrixin family metalloprotease n=1 Tax=Streptococcus caprae TaxID=1640501 RepID=A0ABV8CSE6_9STRE
MELIKHIWTFILWLPRLILRIVWSVVKLVLLLIVIAFCFLYYAYHSQSEFAQIIRTGLSQLEQLYDSGTLTSLSSEQSLQTDSHETTTGARWETNQATIYIASTDEQFVTAYQEAIAVWNATGAFTFVIVSDEASADIVATDQSDASTEAAGLCQTDLNLVTNRIYHATVYLNSYYLLNADYGYSADRITNTAAHELGHAIGLEHNDSEESLMQSAGSYYGIQATDIAAVQNLYQN